MVVLFFRELPQPGNTHWAYEELYGKRGIRTKS